MNKRYDDMLNHSNYSLGKDYFDLGYKPYVIFFDELMACMALAEKKIGDEIKSRLLNIIAKGRQAGVFCILSSQRADTRFIDGAIRDQLGFRIALGRCSSDSYSMVFGTEYSDLVLTNNSKGSGFVFVDGVTTTPLQFETPLLSN
jgi:DNA segregation ATPase FtsK/SpoIIIE-like protein